MAILDALVKVFALICMTVVILALIGSRNINKNRKDGKNHD